MWHLLLSLVLLCFHGGAAIQHPDSCKSDDVGNYKVMYYLLFDGTHKHLAYCTSFDENLYGIACHLMRSHMVTAQLGGEYDLVMNMDYGVLQEERGNNEIKMQDVGTPIAYWNVRHGDHTTNVDFHVLLNDDVNNDTKQYCDFPHRSYSLRDTEKHCTRSNTCIFSSDPLVLDFLNMALYLNQNHAKNAYFFVKKDTNVAVYIFPFFPLTASNKLYGGPEPSRHTAFTMTYIQNFPHENYQENFFAFDPHYGCFALLYWDGNRSHLPEVHYYYFDEEHPNAEVKLVDKIVLHGFDFYDIFDKTKGYHENIMTFPVFKSFGRQVFIAIQTTPKSHHHRFRIWTPNQDETHSSDDCNFEWLQSDIRGIQRTFVVNGHWIRTEKATPHPPSSVAPPPSSQPITVKPPITAPITIPRTTPEATTPSPSTAAPSTSMPSTTLPPSSTTSNDSSATNNGINGDQPTPAYSPGKAEPLKAQECTTAFYNNLYLLIALIVIDVIEAIVLVILVFLKSRGAKKLKEALARKKSLKSKSSIKQKKPDGKSMSKKKKKSKMPWTKKSVKEKTVTSKTEDAATGKTADEKSTTQQTADQSNYYTANQSFDKSKKKGKK